jgi:hypothetical protein
LKTTDGGLPFAAMTNVSLAAWLAEAGLRNLPFEELVDGFARGLNDRGVPAARIFAGMNTVHPMVLARSLIWDRATGPATHFEFQHTQIDHPTVQTSPFVDMLRGACRRGVSTSGYRPSRASHRCSPSYVRSA